MNKIVVKDYPVSNLPEELRVGLEGLGSVTLTIEEARSFSPKPIMARDLVAQLRAEKAEKGPEGGVSSEQAVARIRALRDEWED